MFVVLCVFVRDQKKEDKVEAEVIKRDIISDENIVCAFHADFRPLLRYALLLP